MKRFIFDIFSIAIAGTLVNLIIHGCSHWNVAAFIGAAIGILGYNSYALYWSK